MRLPLALAIMLSLAAPVRADLVTDQMVAALQEQGYEILEMHRTWLGRVRVIAESANIRREIVFNPGTGEILRDYAVDLVAMAARADAEAARRAAEHSSPPVAATAVSDELRADEPESLMSDAILLPEAIVTNPEE